MNNKHWLTITASALTIFLAGCGTLRYQQTYHHIAPGRYEPVPEAKVFEYKDVNIADIYRDMYSDFLIVGQAGFTGGYEDPAEAGKFASSMGADILVATTHYLNTTRTITPVTTPVASTTTITGYTGSGSPMYGTAITWGNQTTMVPVTAHRFEQRGYYLKNVNNVTPVWDQGRDNYLRSKMSIYDGVWKNENYVLAIYQSGTSVVAVLRDMPKNKKLKKSWKKDDLKMKFDPADGEGLFMMDDKKPVRAEFSINNFNHLVVRSGMSDDVFSFEKIRSLPELES